MPTRAASLTLDPVSDQNNNVGEPQTWRTRCVRLQTGPQGANHVCTFTCAVFLKSGRRFVGHVRTHILAAHSGRREGLIFTESQQQKAMLQRAQAERTSGGFVQPTGDTVHATPCQLGTCSVCAPQRFAETGAISWKTTNQYCFSLAASITSSDGHAATPWRRRTGCEPADTRGAQDGRTERAT
jgi:hypothetical protein